MTAIVPSYVAKLGRAKKHLIDLEVEIARYAATKPYAVRDSVEGKKKRKVRTLKFTSHPANTDIPPIAADAIHNLRSCLDHLMSALVAPKDRASAIFPIFFEDVWEPSIPGENAQRTKERERWASCTKTLGGDALAILKELQPPDLSGKPRKINALVLINRLSNSDRHTKLPVIANGLDRAVTSWDMPDGRRQAKAAATPEGFLEDQAEIRNVPHRAVNVQIEGTVTVAVRIEDNEWDQPGFAALPRDLLFAAEYIERHVLTDLVHHAVGS